MKSVISHIINNLDSVSYSLLAAIMALESTCFPVIIPSEVILLPMGYLAYLGKKNMLLLIISSTIGIIIGCLINYFTALLLGRSLLYKYGKYFFLKVDTLEYIEKVFSKYGKVIIFIGRFIPVPVFKHIVTIPAGLYKMNLKDFIVMSGIGGTIFSTIVLYIGYLFGSHMENIKRYSHALQVILAITIVATCTGYLIFKTSVKKNTRKNIKN